MKLGDLLNSLATKIGAQNEQSLVSLLSSSEIANREIDDSLAGMLDSRLMSLDGAKNNRDVLNHYKPIILKGIDDKFAIVAEQYGIADSMSAEKSTYNKFDILTSALEKKIEELKKNGSGADKDAEVKNLTAQLQGLQKQLQDLTAAKDGEIAKLKDDNAKTQLDMLVNFELGSKQYANKDLGDTNVTIARALLDKALLEHKAVLVNDNGQLRIRQAENTALDVLDASNNPLKFADFTNKLLADKHMLTVSGGAPAPQNKPQVQQPAQLQDNGTFSAAAAAALADLK